MVCPIDGILCGHSKYLRRLCKNMEKYLETALHFKKSRIQGCIDRTMFEKQLSFSLFFRARCMEKE